MKKIIMTVPRGGLTTGDASVTTETSGFTGTACQDATNGLLQAVGDVEGRRLTPEYYERPTDEHVSTGQG